MLGRGVGGVLRVTRMCWTELAVFSKMVEEDYNGRRG